MPDAPALAAASRIRSRTFAALTDNPAYRRFYLGQGVSLIGTWLQTAAVSWIVFDMTHSEWMLGVVDAIVAVEERLAHNVSIDEHGIEGAADIGEHVALGHERGLRADLDLAAAPARSEDLLALDDALTRLAQESPARRCVPWVA